MLAPPPNQPGFHTNLQISLLPFIVIMLVMMTIIVITICAWFLLHMLQSRMTPYGILAPTVHVPSRGISSTILFFLMTSNDPSCLLLGLGPKSRGCSGPGVPLTSYRSRLIVQLSSLVYVQNLIPFAPFIYN